MNHLSGWTAALPALAAILVVAGGAKVARPADLARALRQSGVPVGTTLVRIGSLAEVAVGSAVLVTGGRIGTAALAASYLGFAGFVAVALRRGTPLANCGCFGEPDTPPTVAHAAVCGGGGAIAVLAAWLSPPPGFGTTLGALGLPGAVGFCALTITAAGALYLVMTSAPGLVVARRSLRGEA